MLLASDDSKLTMGTPKLEQNPHGLLTALRGGFSLVSIGDISEQGPRPLLIN